MRLVSPVYKQLLNERQRNVYTTEFKASKRPNKHVSNVQAGARCPSSKSSLSKQRQQRQRKRQLTDDLTLNPRISREFRFIQFVYTVRNISNRIRKTAPKFVV